MRLLPASALLVVAVSLFAQRTDSAVAQLQSLQARLHKSHTANDWPANLVAARELKTLLNDDPATLLEVARAEIHVGDFAAAFRELQQFVRMGQSTDLTAPSLDFAPHLAKPEFVRIQSAMEANRMPISLASTALLLPGSNLLPEDLDYDPNGHRFLVTSVLQKKIIAISVGGAGDEFAKAPDNWPMMAIKIDRPRSLVWATEVALQGFSSAPEPDWGRSAVLCYDLKTGKLLRRVEGPRGSSLGDMSLLADGGLAVSDGDGGGVYRLTAKGSVLQRLDTGDFISPQTPTMGPDGHHIFVPDYERGIAVLELSTGQVRWLATAGRFALNGIDGLYFDRGKLIAVQNGTSPERVVAFTLNPALSAITSETILERSTDTLGDPTHGVVVGNDFYYIADSGWNNIDEHGNMKPGAKLSVPRLMRVRIQGSGRPIPAHTG
jgi:hypothetical protein